MATTSQAENWRFPEIIEYFRSDPEIAAQLSEADFDEIFNYSGEWIKLVNSALEYQGKPKFDPRVIKSLMIRNRKSYEAQKPATLVWDLSKDDYRVIPTSLKKHKFSNMASFSEDVKFLVKVFLTTRNGHIDKILKKSSSGLQDILGMLKEKYSIDDDIHTSGTKAITLPRIAAVFPAAAVRMFHDKAVKEIVTYESFPGNIKPVTHGICCPQLPSLAPQSVMQIQGSNFHPVMLWVAVKLDDIIQKKDNSVTSIADILSHYRARYQTSATTEKTRIYVFKHLGLLMEGPKKSGESEYSLSPEASTLAQNCLNNLGQMRTTDENHELLMRVAKYGDMNCF